MRIGELARQGGCEVETIRFYEREDLLDHPARDANGYRRYAASHLAQLNFIRHCRSLGIGLSEVRTLRDFQANPDLACDEINEMVDEHIRRIHQQVESLRALEGQLHALRDSCSASRKARECGIMRNLERPAGEEWCSCHSRG